MLAPFESVMLERGVVAIVDEEYCSPCGRNFFMARNVFKFGLSCGIDVKDEEGKLVYQVDRWGASPGQKKVIRDASRTILLSLNCKTKWNDEWVAYRDHESKNTEIFRMTPRATGQLSKKCKMCMRRTVAENAEKEIFEMKKRSFFARNYTVFHGENIIAEVRSFSWHYLFTLSIQELD
ncbi:hypothetical protein O6H91_07G108700 [Diphasiastrum complanatum]|uniref:Uncharacterized protein n=1 Tax=Diphasiastrum complanatum TaxID=34168 RepID=A0ACC2D8F3_DIPCM|nr:hypothetical protein O6H91_07G108700 [Diphasiastrum complanatum]